MPICGTETYIVDGKNYAAQHGEYFIFNPKQSAKAVGSFEKEVEGYCIFITEDAINQSAHAIGTSDSDLLNSPFDYSWQQHEFLVKSYRLQENNFGNFLFRVGQHLLHPNDNYLIDWDAFYFELAVEFS